MNDKVMDANTQDLPPIEDLFNPFSQEYCDDPVPQLLELNKRGRMVFYAPWQAWMMTKIDDIKWCWREEPLSSDLYDWEFMPPPPPEEEWNNYEKALIGHSLLSDPTHHRLIRKIVSPAFSRNVVDEIQRQIEPEVKKLFDDIGDVEKFDYKKEIAEKIPFISITRIVGIPEKYWEDFEPVVRYFTEAFNPTLPEEQRNRAVEATNVAIDILKEVIAERREQPRQNDFLSALLQVEKDQPDSFDEWDIITLVCALIGAGSDTTLMAQQWVAYSLLKHRDQLPTAIASPESFTHAFAEVERWGIMAKMGFARYAPEDMELCGAQVTKGQMVLMMPQVQSWDPDYCENPEKFDVTRVFKPELQFGYGPRFCIGAALAKNQLHVSMCELLRRFPNVELAEEPKRSTMNHNAIEFEAIRLKTNI